MIRIQTQHFSAEDPLTRLLREGDPLVEDPGLSPDQRVALRRTVLARVPEGSTFFRPQLSPALAVAALLALALGVAWWPSATHETQSVPLPRGEATLTLDTPRVRTETLGAGNALENRKIQFEVTPSMRDRFFAVTPDPDGQKDSSAPAVAPRGDLLDMGAFISTAFTATVGQTVVVGSSRLNGGDEALIVLFTALP